MIRVIENVLDAGTLEEVRGELAQARFIDGKETAHGMAKAVKSNLQLDPAQHAPLITRLTETILRNAQFHLWTMPARMTPVTVSRYEPGMVYGAHSDDALIGGARTDVSFTLFLADPASYQGGELTIDTGFNELKFKLQAGGMVVYPSGDVHRVIPVTEGVRLAAVGWVQSRIRDSRQREVVADLERVRKAYLARHGPDALADLMLKTSGNLQRMWLET